MGDPGPSGAQPAPTVSPNTNLFTGPTPNEPLRFHIHTAIAPKLKAELIRLIESHGGKVHKRLIDLNHPFYALVAPGSSTLGEYATYVSTREPPTERGTVVPYCFVRASIIACRVLSAAECVSDPHVVRTDLSSPPDWAPLALTRGSRQLRERMDAQHANPNSSTAHQPEPDGDGWGGLEPVAVHLHASLTQDERTRLALKIAKAGGDPTQPMSAARVVIANEDHAEFARLKKQYEHSLTTYVEPVSWVSRCLDRGYYVHDPVQKAPMGGRKPGADRNDFTTEDDTRLAQFIAKRIPNKPDGGRTGNNLYKDLCDRTDIYPWAASHTWQSWRNRYRKKQDYFDPIIDRCVAKRQHDGDGKAEYGYSRGKKRAVREDSPTSSADGREKKRRASKEAAGKSQRGQTNPKRKRQPESDANAGSVRGGARATKRPRDPSEQPAGPTRPAASPSHMEPNRPVPLGESAREDPSVDLDLATHTPGGGIDFYGTDYGYGESINEARDKARDLGLSDYLTQDFVSTW